MATLKIQKRHEEILNFLLNYNKNDNSFKFSLRKSNRYDRLNEGYWFHGNDYYLALSFWNGMDWKNRTPNIIFVILEDGQSFLEVNTSDSDLKKAFVERFLTERLNLKGTGKRKKKDYKKHKKDYISSLKAFLVEDKIQIDECLTENINFFDIEPSSRISLISDNEFNKSLLKINNYRNRFKDLEKRRNNKSEKGDLVKLASLTVNGFSPIDSLHLNQIPENTQWIFLTGENGAGKTSILKAIATVVCNRKATDEKRFNMGDARIAASFYDEFGKRHSFASDNKKPSRLEPILVGFAAYGASRLRTDHEFLSDNLVANTIDQICRSLFDENPILFDFQKNMITWATDEIKSQRLSYLKEILTSILPNLVNIDFKPGRTDYIEEDENGDILPPVGFEDLASGLKSVVATIGDLLLRLFLQQPSIVDPSEFRGIVLIDEIDVHLHPNFQMKIVEELSASFPSLQFIATTHSPIPLLGAPKGKSEIFLITRSKKTGVKAKRLNDIDFKNLLPNTLLTSPIFGLNSLRSRNTELSEINPDDSWDDTQFFNAVDKKIEELENESTIELDNYFSTDDQDQ